MELKLNQIRSWIVPSDNFSIAGINVFDYKNSVEFSTITYDLLPEKYTDVDNSFVDYYHRENAKLYHYIDKSTNIYVAISTIEEYYLVTLFFDGDEIGGDYDDVDYSSIYNYMQDTLVSNENEGVLYSENKNYAVKIIKREDGLYLYSLEKIGINLWSIIDFPRNSKNIYWDYFEFYLIKESLYDSLEHALNDAKIELKNLKD